MASADCVNDGDHTCASCTTGYTLDLETVGQCGGNTCSCSDGTSATVNGPHALCATDGNEFCTECDSGYTLTQQFTCQANTCFCDNGDSITLNGPSADCVGAGSGLTTTYHVCDPNSCETGYTYGLISVFPTQCRPNSCSCGGGLPAGMPDTTQDQCLVSGTEVCVSCFDGHTLHLNEQDKCGQNTCTCNYGISVTSLGVGNSFLADERCLTDGTELCDSCNAGSRKDDDLCDFSTTGCECVQNSCNCPNGVAVADGDATCTTDGATVCASCDPGYSGSECEANTCTCPAHGVNDSVTWASGDGNSQICANDGDIQCMADGTQCDTGFILNGQAGAENGPNTCESE